jgi:hypothetical protein
MTTPVGKDIVLQIKCSVMEGQELLEYLAELRGEYTREIELEEEEEEEVEEVQSKQPPSKKPKHSRADL